MSQKIVFFDIDGTLLNTGGAGQTALERAITLDFAASFPFDGVLTAGRTDRGILNEMFERFGVDNTPGNRDRFRAAYLAHLPQCLSERPGFLLPGVTELLERLAVDDRVILSLLTGNYAEGAWAKLKHFRLDHYFQFGGFGDDEAHRDDVARQALAEAVRVLNRQVHGAEVVVIGDTPADIQCARAVGGTAIAVATGTYTVNQLKPFEPDHLFEDLSSTDTVLDRILGCC